MEPEEQKRIVVVGVGDPLLADDGLGVHALTMLEEHGVPEHVALVNGGDDAHRAAKAVSGYDCVLLVDAVCCGREPGCVHVLSAGDLSNRGARLSHHGASFLNMIEFEHLSGGQFDEVYVIGMEPATMHFGMGLSECCRMKLPDLLSAVRAKIESYGM